jgi:hypothetical protein
MAGASAALQPGAVKGICQSISATTRRVGDITGGGIGPSAVRGDVVHQSAQVACKLLAE